MPVPFPHHYSATISRTFASRARVEAAPRPTLQGGPSPELDGDTTTWSPEHLILSSLGLCMLTTFEAFCARDGITLLDWNASMKGSVERSPDGLMFSSIVLCIDMEVTDADRVEATLEDAKRYCLILNSLSVPVVVETTIRTPGHTGEQIAA
ncbi:MAG TPA: OsmC family protein [Kofleriaceae bacterium]|jgi:organic hydroperoxide reductase OsmC/OhrA